MKIAIPGGTGQVGTLLARAFQRDGHEVTVLARTVKPAPWRVVKWDPARLEGWAHHLAGTDVVINLAGRSVNCRYTPKNRREILQSRVESVAAVGRAIAKAARAPSVWLQASTATIYAHRYDAPNDEFSGVIGGNEPDAPETWRFSIDVVKAWEKAFDDVPAERTRKVKLRSAMIMNPDAGSIFDTLLTLARRGLAGTAGDGRQYISWPPAASIASCRAATSGRAERPARDPGASSPGGIHVQAPALVRGGRRALQPLQSHWTLRNVPGKGPGLCVAKGWLNLTVVATKHAERTWREKQVFSSNWRRMAGRR